MYKINTQYSRDARLSMVKLFVDSLPIIVEKNFYPRKTLLMCVFVRNLNFQTNYERFKTL